MRVDGRYVRVELLQRGETTTVLVDGKVVDFRTTSSSGEVSMWSRGVHSDVRVESERERAHASRAKQGGASDLVVRAPMPGRIVRVSVKPGDEVELGASLAVVEAMKMENDIVAKRAGTIAEVKVKPGDTIEANAVLIAFG